MNSLFNNSTGLGTALLVGLTAGVSTCMALIGGLVLSLSTQHTTLHPEATRWQKFRPHLFFNLGRIIGFFFLGGLVGWLGSFFKLSNNLFSLLTILVSLVMIFLGLKLLNIFPLLKKINITLPLFIGRRFGLVKGQSEYSHRGAMISGILTFFLPCGFTQAMQLAAVATGSFWFGGLIMSLFAFGTSFGLLGIGGLSSVFIGKKAKVFSVVVGLVVIILGLFNIVNASSLLFQTFVKQTSTAQINNTEVQEIYMTQDYSGYNPKVLTVKKGRPVKWIINSTNPYTCASSLVVSEYNISKRLQKGENIIEFTPMEIGEIPFSCSMGMYRGKFIVED